MSGAVAQTFPCASDSSLGSFPTVQGTSLTHVCPRVYSHLHTHAYTQSMVAEFLMDDVVACMHQISSNACTHARMHACTHARTHAHMHVNMFVDIYTHAHTVRTGMCIYTCRDPCPYTCLYTCLCNGRRSGLHAPNRFEPTASPFLCFINRALFCGTSLLGVLPGSRHARTRAWFSVFSMFTSTQEQDKFGPGTKGLIKLGKIQPDAGCTVMPHPTWHRKATRVILDFIRQ